MASHVRIRIHRGKTQMWNQLGVEPPVCAALQREVVACGGDLGCPPTNRAFASWVLQWATLIS